MPLEVIVGVGVDVDTAMVIPTALQRLSVNAMVSFS